MHAYKYTTTFSYAVGKRLNEVIGCGKLLFKQEPGAAKLAAKVLDDLGYDPTEHNLTNTQRQSFNGKNSLGFTFPDTHPKYGEAGTTTVDVTYIGERFPLTKAGFMEWAMFRVKAEPSVNGKKNTSRRVLAQLASSIDTSRLMDWDDDELRDELLAIMYAGCKGTKDQTTSESLKAICEHAIEQNYDEHKTVEEYLAHLTEAVGELAF